MKFLKTYIFFFLALSYTMISAQTLGDFRSFQDGNWSDSNSWEYFDGASWISPISVPANTNYPGDGAVAANDVTIIGGNNISLGANIAGNINSVTIGDRTGGVDTLTITGTSNLETTNFTIAYDGLLIWGETVNKTFSLSTGTILTIENPTPHPNGLTIGVDHGVFVNPTCSASKILKIGSNKYASCNGGGGADGTFASINASGGNQTLTVFIIPSKTESCKDQTITFEAFPSGTAYDSDPLATTYVWSATPITGGITVMDSSTTSAIPTTTGEIIYQVDISNSGNNASNTVSITINTCGKVVTNRRITFRVKK